MRNDDLRAERDDPEPYLPHSQKRGKNLVLQIALGVFLGGLALWLVQLAATSLLAKLMLGSLTLGG
ncbi:hypothetical protein [Pseudomonas sp. L5B5]|uniref:hypothetical protein n=1 Tax=Pseudomonas sp. L5B5 TaxID=2883205 RepID=UPI001CFA3206|nr:hypothetical protein [Pseudomonas sp. L5B5]UCZ86387.1 hypothetical protein LGQ10_08895 [Pseudomonas sp. L5B5]